MAKRGHAESVRDGPKLRHFQVRANDVWDDVYAHYVFDNGAEGLTFRRHEDDSPDKKTRVVASYAQGYWQTYKESE